MGSWRRYLIPLLLALGVAISLWPSLWWVEFSNESEELVAAAALESLRDGSPERIWRPTLGGEPRLRKPPLATWVAMAATSTAEARELARGPLDAGAFQWVAVKMRTGALLVGVAMLILTFELGRLLGGRSLGLIALAVLASSYGFLTHTIRVTTDLHLALWVLAANVALLHATLRRGRGAVMALAGAALGLAMMAKGPVALVQTVVPVVVLLLLRRWMTSRALRGRALSSDAPGGRRLALGCGIGLLLFAGIGLPWYLDAFRAAPAAASQWVTEVSRVNATGVGADDPWDYVILLGLVLPWTLFFVIGLLLALGELVHRLSARRWGVPGIERWRGPGILCAAALVVVPLAIMVWFPDRKARYLVPLFAPAAVVAGYGILGVWRDARKHPVGARAAWVGHFLLIAIVLLGAPVAMMLLPRNEVDGDLRPWLGPGLAIPLLILAVLLLAAAILVARRFRLAGILAGSVAAMLFAANLFLAGYGRSYEGRSQLKPLAEAVRAVMPEAQVAYGTIDHPPADLPLYFATIPTYAADAPGHGVVVLVELPRTDPPPEAPPGWRLIAQARREGTMWYAFADEADLARPGAAND